jgi:predicted AAA+ superfamily ATPase
MNDRSSNWLKKLKDAAYDAEDLVCKFHIEAEKHELEVAGVKNVVVKYLWTKPKSVVFERNIAQKIKVIKNAFDAIVKGRSDYSTIVNSIPVDQHVQGISKTIGEVPLWTTVDETSIFGRDQEKNLLISKLIETSDEQKINIVSVIGLGGSGKTTLAKLVFNDGNTIREHFDVLLWVHVSREFAVEKLVEKLFEAIAGDKHDHLSLQRVTRTISEELFGKKFLLVLDDVWTEDRIHWERFMVHLKGGAHGSSILLTTPHYKSC